MAVRSFADIGTSRLTCLSTFWRKCREAGGRIMSLHSRRASGALLDYLERFTEAGTPVLHWFSGSFRELETAIDLGCWFSVGPAMLASEKGRALAARMPRERVLTESDGPFAQLNGEAVMPWHVEQAVGDLALIWSVPQQDVRQLINRNLRSLLQPDEYCKDLWAAHTPKEQHQETRNLPQKPAAAVLLLVWRSVRPFPVR